MSIDDHYAAFLKGIDEYNAAMFFECHDTWEEIWHEISGKDKRFLHGLIQTSIGLYHFTNKNAKGARSMFAKAFSKLAHYKPVYRGIDVSEMMQHIETVCFPVIVCLEQGNDVVLTNSMLPKIILQSST